jgi:hypothetical protein
MSNIKRYDLIQQAINAIKKKKIKVNYLEIGVQTGLCFFKIKADNKIAVDPNFIIKITKKIKAYAKNFSNFNNTYFELTSDDFFEQQATYLNKIGGLDVVFIDGLHLYEQVVIDFENSLKYLNNGGIFLLHDCNPPTETASIRGMSPAEVRDTNPQNWTGEWNGDVWKAIMHIRSERDDVQVMVFDCDYGIGMVRKGTPDKTFSFTKEQIINLTYQELDKNREEYLNLKTPETFLSIL